MHASPPRLLSPAYVHRQAIEALSFSLPRSLSRAPQQPTDAKTFLNPEHVLLLQIEQGAVMFEFLSTQRTEKLLETKLNIGMVSGALRERVTL